MLMMADVDIVLNRPSTLPISIWKKLMMVIGEVDLCPISDTFLP